MQDIVDDIVQHKNIYQSFLFPFQLNQDYFGLVLFDNVLLANMV